MCVALYFYMFSDQIIKQKLSQYWRVVRISPFKWHWLYYSSLTIVKDSGEKPTRTTTREGRLVVSNEPHSK